MSNPTALDIINNCEQFIKNKNAQLRIDSGSYQKNHIFYKYFRKKLPKILQFTCKMGGSWIDSRTFLKKYQNHSDYFWGDLQKIYDRDYFYTKNRKSLNNLGKEYIKLLKLYYKNTPFKKDEIKIHTEKFQQDFYIKHNLIKFSAALN